MTDEENVSTSPNRDKPVMNTGRKYLDIYKEKTATTSNFNCNTDKPCNIDKTKPRNTTQRQTRKFFANKWAIRAFTTSCFILLVLIITYVPLSVLIVIENIRGIYLFKGRVVIFCLPFLSSLLNPIIYLWRITDFRQTLTQKCKCWS